MPYTVLMIYILKPQNKHKPYQTTKKTQTQNNDKTHTEQKAAIIFFHQLYMLPLQHQDGTQCITWHSLLRSSLQINTHFRVAQTTVAEAIFFPSHAHFIMLFNCVCFNRKIQLAGILQNLAGIIPAQLHWVQHLPSQAEHQLHFQSILSNQWWVGTVRAKEWSKHHGTIKGLKQKWLISFNWHPQFIRPLH